MMDHSFPKHVDFYFPATKPVRSQMKLGVKNAVLKLFTDFLGCTYFGNLSKLKKKRIQNIYL